MVVILPEVTVIKSEQNIYECWDLDRRRIIWLFISFHLLGFIWDKVIKPLISNFIWNY